MLHHPVDVLNSIVLVNRRGCGGVNREQSEQLKALAERPAASAAAPSAPAAERFPPASRAPTATAANTSPQTHIGSESVCAGAWLIDRPQNSRRFVVAGPCSGAHPSGRRIRPNTSLALRMFPKAFPSGRDRSRVLAVLT